MPQLLHAHAKMLHGKLETLNSSRQSFKYFCAYLNWFLDFIFFVTLISKDILINVSQIDVALELQVGT